MGVALVEEEEEVEGESKADFLSDSDGIDG